ncbi:hypothetical protein PUMCH_001051 [Australozyma saopauloensis]|uniref:non-specific serine/threonine protein kinase n=1 Tax=Australozyma saopauloensis TaxID=291208 RepID=A0AAX4H7U9_9ASCO|nr:hypothetical protein PUMCH_001051 [[Candida] saopauloensis]
MVYMLLRSLSVPHSKARAYPTTPVHRSMGANLSLLAPQAHTVAARSYVDILSNYEFLSVRNNSRFLKTMEAYDRTSGMLVAIKIFIKPPQGKIDLRAVAENIAQEALLLAQHLNVLTWHQVLETPAAGYLVRQLAKANLYDRLSLRPFLAPIEKLWLVYQLLRAVELLHEDLHICHGDIKTENILLTSANWLVLSDFAQHTKPVYLPDDNPSEFVFYFDSSNRRSCYVAPERFYSKSERASVLQNRSEWKLSSGADLFSVGCVIAELYMDGEATFTLSDLYKYKRGESSPNLGRILNPEMRNVVRELLNLEADKRPSAAHILESSRGALFPNYFYDFLYDFIGNLNSINGALQTNNDENYSESDEKIDYIYANYEKVSLAFNFDYSMALELNPSKTKFPYMKTGLPGVPKDYKFKTANQIKEKSEGSGQQQGVLMILDIVFSLMGSLRRPRSKVRACEIIVALSERIFDESKLDRSLPYLCSLLEEFIDEAMLYQNSDPVDPTNITDRSKLTASVARVSLIAITNLLRTCSGINAINALVFPEYICPLLKNIAFLNYPSQDEVSLLKCTLARCFPFLAIISNKFKLFLEVALTEGGDAVTLKDDDMRGLCSSASVRVEPDFRDVAEALLTDVNVNVRVTLINNILPLCQFFGVDKTNDIILPHLITYLNDPSYQLRLAFLSSIKEIGGFIGVLSFEQYILPLLIQVLGDTELFIVLKVLNIFHYFVNERLINPAAEFNAWSIYKDMLQSSILLLLQPNEWIRQNVIFLILAISENLLNADRFCFLYPIIKTYLSYDITQINWDTLYPSLTRPVSKQVIETSLAWLLSASSKSLFWKQTRISVFQQNGRKKLVSFHKEMGRSVYADRMIPRTNPEDSFASGDIPLSFEDKQWVLKLKSVGLAEKDLWKVFALKDYLIGSSRSANQTVSHLQREFELATSINISPKNMFFEICYKSEPINSGKKGIQANVEYQEASNISVISRKDSLSLVLPHNGKAKASTQTHEANVFGELELHHEDKPSQHRHLHSNSKNSETTHRILSTNDEKIISTMIRHNFGGTNPFILQFLKNVEFEPSLDDFSEFGQLIKGSRESSNIRADFNFSGVQVSSFNLNDSFKSIDAITKVAVCPTSEIIVTGSRSGKVKVWETSKLETSLSDTPSIAVDLGQSVTDIVFIPHRWVFAISTVDGYIRLFRIHAVRGKNRKIVKLSKLIPVRKTKLDDGYAKMLQFVTSASKMLCVMVTFSCRVIALDVIKMEKVIHLQNPLRYGITLTFTVCNLCSWILVGTSEGVLCLWDVRFGLLLASWRVAIDGIVGPKTEIKKLTIVPKPPNCKKHHNGVYFAMIGGAEGADVTVWEMPSLACRQYYSAHEENPKIRSYSLHKIESLRDISVDDILAELSLDLNQHTAKGLQFLDYIEGKPSALNGHLVLVTDEQRVIIWNWKDVTRSTLLFADAQARFTRNDVSPSLCVNNERLSQNASAQKRHSMQNDERITDLCFVYKPYPMLVVVKDDGYMHVYK